MNTTIDTLKIGDKIVTDEGAITVYKIGLLAKGQYLVSGMTEKFDRVAVKINRNETIERA